MHVAVLLPPAVRLLGILAVSHAVFRFMHNEHQYIMKYSTVVAMGSCIVYMIYKFGLQKHMQT